MSSEPVYVDQRDAVRHQPVYVRRRRTLPTEPGSHPGAGDLVVEIRIRCPESANVSYVREQLDKAYVDALFELLEREPASEAGGACDADRPVELDAA